MIIPWSHDSGQLRRTPYVTYALMVLCVLAAIGTTSAGSGPILEDAEDALWEAYGYWEERPYLEGPRRLVQAIGPLPPKLVARWEERAEAGIAVGPSAWDQEVEQAQLDALVADRFGEDR